MSTRRNLKHVEGLKELDALLDGLTDPKFRARALRAAAKKTMEPVKEVLKSKIPAGISNDASYKHYETKDGHYKRGDLKDAVITRTTINTNKAIKLNRAGNVKGNQLAEMRAVVTFKNDYAKLASILENGRSRRDASTKDGKVFHYYGKRTDKTHRDIGTFEPKNFVSETAAQCEGTITSTFKTELTTSIAREVKRLQRRRR